MGGSNSKTPTTNEEDKQKFNTFVGTIKSNVEDGIARRMMLQREIQMAINIARARDTLWIYGSAWAMFTTGVVSAKAIMGRAVPPVAGVPVVVGALVLGNMADMAYGNKLQRVTKEAQYLLEYERGRFVPVKEAPFSKFYSDEEKAALFDPATAVGDLFPNNIFAHKKPLPEPKKKDE